MKTLFSVLSLSYLIALLGCQTAPTSDQLDRAQNVARVAVQTGATAALIAKPEIRPALKLSLKSITAAVDSGRVTATQLGSLVAGLPVKSDTLRIVNGICLLFDSLSVLWIDPSTEAAVLAVATGVKDGLAAALSAPVMDSAPSAIKPAKSPALLIPDPNTGNTRKL